MVLVTCLPIDTSPTISPRGPIQRDMETLMYTCVIRGCSSLLLSSLPPAAIGGIFRIT